MMSILTNSADPDQCCQVLSIHIYQHRGGSRISGKGVHMYRGVEGLALLIFISFFLISHENEIIWSH